MKEFRRDELDWTEWKKGGDGVERIDEVEEDVM